jgi:hypothetical protein
MNKPRHPQNYMKPPRESWIKEEDIAFEDGTPLKEICDAWEKKLVQLTNDCEMLVSGPDITVFSDMCDSKIGLTYFVEITNGNYDTEKLEWDREFAKYEKDLAEWNEKGPESIDSKILKTTKILENLKAVKENRPVPFPEIK